MIKFECHGLHKHEWDNDLSVWFCKYCGKLFINLPPSFSTEIKELEKWAKLSLNNKTPFFGLDRNIVSRRFNNPTPTSVLYRFFRWFRKTLKI